MSSALTRLGLDRAAMLHGLRLSLAAWLAFCLALLLHIPNPYWAAMPVWVVAQAQRGLLLERGFFRLLGTLLGAGLGLLILQLPGPPPVALAALALVAACGAGLTHVLPGVQGYGALLLGMTPAVVVLPSLLLPALPPGEALALGLARVECTLIGVAMVTLVTGLFTPATPPDALATRARALAEAVLAHLRQPEPRREAALLAEISALDAAAPLLAAGSPRGYRALARVRALVLAALSALALAHDGAPQRRLRAAQRRMHATLAAMERHDSPATLPPPHPDWSLALAVGGTTGGATFLAAMAALALGQPAAELTAMGVCIFSMVLGSMPAPQRVAPWLMLGVACGVALAFLYRWLAQPHLDAPWMVMASLLPVLLLGGQARAARAPIAVAAVDANMCFLLASQAGMAATPPAMAALDGMALLAGALLVGTAFVLLPRRPERHARAAARQLLRDIAALLRQGNATPGWRPRATRHLLRLLLHLGRAGRLATPGSTPGSGPDGLLAMLRLGYAILGLRRIAAAPGPQAPQATMALAALAGFATNPAAVAAWLDQAATGAPAPLERPLLAAAAAVREGEPLFRFAAGQEG